MRSRRRRGPLACLAAPLLLAALVGLGPGSSGARAQWFGPFGFGYPGVAVGYGYPTFGFAGFVGYGVPAYGFPAYPAYGYGLYGPFGNYPPDWYNPATLSLGVTPLAVQAALMERGLRGDAPRASPRLAPGTYRIVIDRREEVGGAGVRVESEPRDPPAP